MEDVVEVLKVLIETWLELEKCVLWPAMGKGIVRVAYSSELGRLEQQLDSRML